MSRSTPTHRQSVRDLVPGDVISEPGIRPGVVVEVARDRKFRDDCRNVLLDDGRVLILHEYRRVALAGRATPWASLGAAVAVG